MARLTKLAKDQVTDEMCRTLFRVYAHRPEILKTLMAHMNAVT